MAIIHGTQADDIRVGDQADDDLFGYDGNDSLDGAGGADKLDGGEGADTLIGGDGNDTLWGGWELQPDSSGIDADVSDRLVGGSGDDTYEVSVTDIIVEDADQGIDSVIYLATWLGDHAFYPPVNYKLAANVENLTFHGMGADFYAEGNELDNIIRNIGNGHATLDGGAGADILIGSDGYNTFVIDDADDQITEGGGFDWVHTSLNEYILPSDIEHLKFIGVGSFHATGNAGSNEIIGADENDTLDGGAGGYDVLVGGKGDDFYRISSNSTVVEEADEGFDVVEITDVTLTDFHELGSNIESVRFVGEGSIQIVANDLDNFIMAGDGNDVIDAGAGSDSIEVGAGDDLVYAGAGNDLIFALDGNDTIEAGDGDDYIGGFAGSDHLYGQGGDDAIWAGDGDDYIDGGSGKDSAVYLGSKLNYVVTPKSDGTVTVVHKAPEEFQEGPFTSTIYEGTDILKGIERITFKNGDTIDVASLFAPPPPEPPVTPVKPEPPVAPPTPPTVFTTTTNFTLPADALDLTASGNGNVKLTGNALNNSITGNAGKNSINAGSGNDKVNGGLGNDSLTGGKGKDAFLFTTKLNKKTNVDKINDFKVVDDTIYLDKTIFKKVAKDTLAKPSKLNKFYFTTGEKAKDANDYIIYNKDKGTLSYDVDGSGKGAAVQFATIDKKLKLGVADFLII